MSKGKKKARKLEKVQHQSQNSNKGGFFGFMGSLAREYWHRNSYTTDQPYSSLWTQTRYTQSYYSPFNSYTITARTSFSKLTELRSILNAVKSISRIHGMPIDTEVRWFTFNEGLNAAGGSTFQDLNNRTKPMIGLDPSVYDTCDKKERLDVYTGIALHETDHLLESAEMFEILANKKKNVLSKRLLVWINLLEDDRIEQLGCKRSPGFIGYYHAMKKHFLEKKLPESEEGKTWDDLPEISKVLDLIFRCLRLPHTLEPHHKNFVTLTHRNPYKDLENLLSARITDFKEVLYYAEEIDKLFKIWIPTEEPDDKTDQDHLNHLRKKLSEYSNEEWETDCAGDSDNETIQSLHKTIADILTKRKEAKKFSLLEANEIIESISVASDGLDSVEAAQYSYAESNKAQIFTDDMGDTIILTPPEKPSMRANEQYRQNRQVIAHQISAMRNAFRLKLKIGEKKTRELTRGQLDGRKLAIAQTTNHIFCRKEPYNKRGFAVCLVVDESGSMGSVHPSSKGGLALQAAILISEAILPLRAFECEAYSFTTRANNCQLKYLYGSNRKIKNSLASYGPSGGNFDYQAIRVAAKRFIANTKAKNRIMFVISDGLPCSNATIRDPILETRKAVLEAQACGIHVVQVNIGNHGHANDIYDNVIQYKDSNIVGAIKQYLINKLKSLDI